ncbi:hypothetical protein AVEN_171481-1 [Araneus ventricosus]|uniref:Uncharacterized protein n=1 Tax=Araneus ventricosus TaxID=182803 RepID=A0A4Y2HB03_ARAVE|nr:hypothetical protein AVEN_171481-1 [Araneus ventricosus]
MLPLRAMMADGTCRTKQAQEKRKRYERSTGHRQILMQRSVPSNQNFSFLRRSSAALLLPLLSLMGSPPWARQRQLNPQLRQVGSCFPIVDWPLFANPFIASGDHLLFRHD